MGIELFEASQRYNGWNGNGKAGVEVEYTHGLLIGDGQTDAQDALTSVSGRFDELEEIYSDPKEYPRYQAIKLDVERALADTKLDLAGLALSELDPAWVVTQIEAGNTEGVLTVAGILVSARNLAGRFQRLDLKVGAEID